MAEITSELVRELREETNLGMMECKKALVDADGDKQKAIRLLRERGTLVAQKKSARVANQGLVASVIKPDGKTGSLVEVNCETDFVARNSTFIDLVNGLATKACESDANLAETDKEAVVALIAKLGENMVIRRSARFVLSGTGTVACYIHLGGKIGVLVEAGCGNETTVRADVFKETVRDVAMHIAASNPSYLDAAAVPADVVASERDICAKQVQGKPANIVDKIVDGKMKKFYAEVCLVDQGFVKDPKVAISQYLEARSKELGDKITIRRFLRFQVGQKD
ncbi:MAG: translation elongation factor Ts [bacterium]